MKWLNHITTVLRYSKTYCTKVYSYQILLNEVEPVVPMLTDLRFEWYFIEYFCFCFCLLLVILLLPIFYAVNRLLALDSLYSSTTYPSPTFYLLILNLCIWETNTKGYFLPHYRKTFKILKASNLSWWSEVGFSSSYAKSTWPLWELFFFLFHACLLPSLLCGYVSHGWHCHKSLNKWSTLLYNHW